MNARALYDYSARNEKELTFAQGDIVDVIEKTPDGNWWHGFHNGASGYIPVSYVEITELHAVPTPPARRSSMQKKDPPEEKASPPTPKLLSPTHAASPLQAVSEEGKEEPDRMEKKEEEVKTDDKEPEKEPDKQPVGKPLNKPTEDIKPKVTEPPLSPPGTHTTTKDKPKKVDIPVPVGSVSKLMQRFHQPEPQPPPPQKTVLVGPHTHRRMSAEVSSRKDGDTPTRSNSGASSLRSATHTTPPPIRPKPPGVGDRDTPTSMFPIMSHDSHVSASPLQKAHLQQQQASSKPVAVKKSGPFKSSKKKDGASGRPPIPTKPAAPPTVAPPAQFQAELRQQLSHRKHDDDRK